MKILFISSYLPYPLFSGGHIRLYNLIRELSKKHKITLVCERRSYQTDNDVGEVSKFCQKVITVPRKKQWSIENVLKTGLSLYPFIMVGHTSKEFRDKIIQELRNNKFDLIHIETFYVMQNLSTLSRVKGLPIVLTDQNIEYMVYKMFANQANFFLRPLLYIDILKIKFWEEKFWRKANYVVVTSEGEKREVEKYNSNVTVVPNGVNLEKFKMWAKPSSLGAQNLKFKIEKKEKTILFIGDFGWIENRDAAEWLLKEIWPAFVKTSAGKPKIKLWIVGKNIPDSIKRLANNNVVFDENAPGDTSEIFKRVDLLLAPIRVGGGGKFKILESMASGVPVVTTTIGIEGIGAKDGQEVLIGDEIESLVRKTAILLNDRNLYEKLAKNARKLIEEKYDWRFIAKKLEKVYESIT